MLKGNKPDFHNAMKAEQSELMYNKFVQVLKSKIPNSDTLVQGLSQVSGRRFSPIDY